MGARKRVGIGLSYRPARLHRLAELIPCESILGLLKSLKIRALNISFAKNYDNAASMIIATCSIDNKTVYDPGIHVLFLLLVQYVL
jgi:hypothetical protein